MENQENEQKLAKFIENNRGSKQLIDDENHLYHINKKSEGRTYWDCTFKKKNGCHATATVYHQKDGLDTVSITGKHNHGSNLAKVKAKVIDREVMKQATTNLNILPSKLLAEAAAKANADKVPEMVLLARRKSGNLVRQINVSRAKVKGYSELPKTMESIASNPLPDRYMTTSSGEPFLIMKDYVSDVDRYLQVLLDVWISTWQGSSQDIQTLFC